MCIFHLAAKMSQECETGMFDFAVGDGFAGGTYASLVRRQLQSGSHDQEKPKGSNDKSDRQDEPAAEGRDMSRQSTGAIVDEVSSLASDKKEGDSPIANCKAEVLLV